MQTRMKFRWIVKLQRDDGIVSDRVLKAYWDPERDDTREAVGMAARAEAFMATNKQHGFAVISVTRAEDES